MQLTPTKTPFLECSPTLIGGAPALFGVPYDGTACFRKGTEFGPDAIREVSPGLESYSPELSRDLAERPAADLGNLVMTSQGPEHVTVATGEACSQILSEGALPVILGGEHSITPGAVRATQRVHPDLAVLQLDAHADLREEWTGGKWSHACAMRRILDHLPSRKLLQCGIRSGTSEEFAELRESKRLISPDPAALAPALTALGDAPLYLTLDLDFFDPSCLPGTGTPEPGGVDWTTFASLLAVLPWDRVVACDIVELAPALDPSGCSSVLAAKVVREILLSLP